MTKAYTLFDPQWGDVPLAVALAATPVTGQQLTAPVISGGMTATGNAVLSTTQVSLLTATQLASLNGGVSVPAGANSVFSTTQITGLTALQNSVLATTQITGLTALQNSVLATTQIGMLTTTQTGTFTNNGTSTVTTSDARVTANSQILITLKTVGGTVGAIPHLLTTTPGTGFATVGTASDTSVYNYAIIG